MPAPKMTTDFNAYWPFLEEMAAKKGLTPSSWFKRAGLARQRYYDFKRGDNISARSFIKLLGGVRLDPVAAARLSGVNYTDDQNDELNLEAKFDADRDLFRKLLNDPERMAQLREEYK